MPTRSVLISYNDYPLSASNLLPDNGLAHLAGCLLARGHQTTILDFATVDIIGRLFPYGFQQEARAIVGKIMAVVLEGGRPDPDDVTAFQEVHRQIEQAKVEALGGLAEEICRHVERQQANFVGMKLWTGSGFSGSLLLAKELRRRFPGIPLFAGGPHVHWFHERVFDATDIFDAVADGEGEEVIWMLAECVEGKRNLQDVPNLMYKRDGRIVKTDVRRIADLNGLPDPVYDEAVYPAMAGDRKIKILLLDESRGCPNSCSFCIHPQISGRKWRVADPEQFVERICRLQGRYGINAFRFAGSNPPQHLTRAIAEKILEKGVKIVFTTNFHARGLEKEALELLKQAGCVGGFFGIESGSQRILDQAMNKKTSVEEMKRALRMCCEVGIAAVGSVIVPTPLGDEQSTRATSALLLEARPDSVLVCFPGLIPGSRWYEHPERYGFNVRKTKDVFRQMMAYDIDLFSPPILWKPLDGYALDGKDFRQLAGESFAFAQQLERRGLTTQVTDEMFLMALAADTPLGELKDQFMQTLLTGDEGAMRALVRRINGGLEALPASAGACSALREA